VFSDLVLRTKVFEQKVLTIHPDKSILVKHTQTNTQTSNAIRRNAVNSDYKSDNLWFMKGDCLERMKEIPDGSVDMVLTDPPYGTTACKWDSIIQLEPMWEQLKRIIKPNGAIVLFGSEPFSSALRMSNIRNYRYDWVWNKITARGHLVAKKFQ
jgi:predicted methyltransferase